MKRMIYITLCAGVWLVTGLCTACSGNPDGEEALSMNVPSPLTHVTVTPLSEDDRATSGDIARVGESINAFAVDMYREVVATDKNLFFSPYSISTAMAMVQAGARGETAEQIQAVFRYHLLEANRLHPAMGALGQALASDEINKQIQLRVANALWLQKDYPFEEKYLQRIRTHYGPKGLYEMDFAADADASRKQINQWVEAQTEEKIKELMGPDTVDALTRLVLTNAIYFKGDWQIPFEIDSTQERPFHKRNGETIDAPTMFLEKSFACGEDENALYLELPYKGEQVSMVVILPKAQNGLPVLEANLSAEALSNQLNQLHNRPTMVYLPKFKAESSLSLNEPLQRLGVKDAFDSQAANLSGISYSGVNPRGDLYVQAAVHKAFVEVNETGTEAAAATGISVGLKSMPAEPFYFRADHPFLFVIRHAPSGAFLFMGRIVDPLAG